MFTNTSKMSEITQAEFEGAVSQAASLFLLTGPEYFYRRCISLPPEETAVDTLGRALVIALVANGANIEELFAAAKRVLAYEEKAKMLVSAKPNSAGGTA